MIKILVVVILVAIIAISAVGIVDNNYGIDYGGYNSFSSSPFLTLTANITHPSPQANFTYGYASPGLWGFQSGHGTTTMSFYSNSSVHTIVKLTNISDGINIFAYPSIHLAYGIPMALSSVYKANLSSYVRFDVKNISNGVQNDLAYDMFLGQNGNYTSEVEIMLINTIGNYPISNQISIPIIVNGNVENVGWSLNIGASGMSDLPRYLFITNVSISTPASFEISFVPFLSYLQNNSYIPPSDSILRIGIGSEFVSIFQPHSYFSGTFDYSFWLYSYFVINGTDYQIVHPAGNTTQPINPPILEARP